MTEFTLTYKEGKRLAKFKGKHYEICRSAVSVIFTPTGIGNNVTVKCLHCLKTKDITEFGCW